MADRRMFSCVITDSEAFLDLTPMTQMLYFHLAMHADDDGFVGNPKRILRMVGAAQGDLDTLLEQKFVIPFDSGVCVIRHWRIHNYIRADRYKETVYKSEKRSLFTDENNAYILQESSGIPNDNQLVDKLDTQVRLGKDRLGKVRIEESTETPPAAATPTHPQKSAKKKHGQYGWVRLTDEEHSRLLNDLGEPEFKRCVAYIDESAQATGNKNKWRDWNLVVRRCHREKWGLGKTAGKPSTRGVIKIAADYDGGESFV